MSKTNKSDLIVTASTIIFIRIWEETGNEMNISEVQKCKKKQEQMLLYWTLA